MNDMDNYINQNTTPYSNTTLIDTYATKGKVCFLEAYDAYCYLHYINGKKKMVSKCLKHVLGTYHFADFKRTHRKYAVNPEYVKRIKNDKTELLLANDQTITISRARKKAVWTWFSQLKNSFN